MGGFIEIMYILFAVVPWYYNKKLSSRKFIKKLYFIDKDEKSASSSYSRSLSIVERFDPLNMRKKTYTKEEKERI